jgi:hypothetical protein
MKAKFFSFTLNSDLTWQDMRDNDKSSSYYRNHIPSKPWIYGHTGFSYEGLHAMIKIYGDYYFAKSRFINLANTKKLKDSNSTDLGVSLNLKKATSHASMCTMCLTHIMWMSEVFHCPEEPIMLALYPSFLRTPSSPRRRPSYEAESGQVISSLRRLRYV